MVRKKTTTRRKRNRTIIKRAKRVIVLNRGKKTNVSGRRNPRGRHLPKAGAKEQRQYEEIKKSELKRGRPLQTAKRIAAATVRKAQAKKKAKNPRRRNKAARVSESDIAKFPAHVQRQLRDQLRSGRKVREAEPEEQRVEQERYWHPEY